MSTRRTVIRLLGGGAAMPFLRPGTTAAQRPGLPTIGVLDPGDEKDPERQRRTQAFTEKLTALGWVPEHNVSIHYRWGPEVAAANELIALKPGVIFAAGTNAVVALKRETAAVPIVFANVSDPVGAGFVTSLAHPGGNITGFTNFEYATSGKWLELLKEITPTVKRVGVLVDPENAQSPGRLHVLADAAPALGVQIVPLQVRDKADIERAIASLADEPNGGLLVPPGTLPIRYRDVIVAASLKQRLPNVHSNAVFARSGGLISYGIDALEQCRQAAGYVDRILKGEKPADLPVQAPTKYELVINLKTAKALGLDVPPTVLARADEVIE